MRGQTWNLIFSLSSSQAKTCIWDSFSSHDFNIPFSCLRSTVYVRSCAHLPWWSRYSTVLIIAFKSKWDSLTNTLDADSKIPIPSSIIPYMHVRMHPSARYACIHPSCRIPIRQENHLEIATLPISEWVLDCDDWYHCLLKGCLFLKKKKRWVLLIEGSHGRIFPVILCSFVPAFPECVMKGYSECHGGVNRIRYALMTALDRLRVRMGERYY